MKNVTTVSFVPSKGSKAWPVLNKETGRFEIEGNKVFKQDMERAIKSANGNKS